MAHTRWLIRGDFNKGLFTEMWVGCDGTGGISHPVGLRGERVHRLQSWKPRAWGRVWALSPESRRTPPILRCAEVLGPHPAGSRGLESLPWKFRGTSRCPEQEQEDRSKRAHGTRGIAKSNRLLPSQGT